MEFFIDNMTCGGCAKSVTKAIQSVDPFAKVEIDLGTVLVKVESQRPASDFITVLDDVGYPPRR